MINTEAAEPLWFTFHVLGPQSQETWQCTTTSPAPLTVLSVQKGAYSCKNTAWEAEEGLFPSQLVEPSAVAYREGAASQRYLSCYGKTTCVNMSPFQLSTSSALKLDSKNHLFLSKLLSALMHRADASIGAKDEEYSRGVNFEHIRAQVAKEMPISSQGNYTMRVLSSLRVSHSRQQ